MSHNYTLTIHVRRNYQGLLFDAVPTIRTIRAMTGYDLRASKILYDRLKDGEVIAFRVTAQQYGAMAAELHMNTNRTGLRVTIVGAERDVPDSPTIIDVTRGRTPWQNLYAGGRIHEV